MSANRNAFKQSFDWVRTVVPLEKRNVFVVYLLIVMGTVLDNMNSAAAMAMASNIQSEFNTNSAITSWVLSGYALTLGSFIMVTGKFVDMYGAHNIFLFGLLIMWVCAIICACLPRTSIIPLIVFRALQGIGASALVPSSISMAANYFTGKYAKYLNKAVIYLIVAMTGSMGIGLILGGAFAETSIGYRGYFYFTFGYALLLDIALFFLIIPVKQTEQQKKLSMKNLDTVASFLVITGILLIILGLIEGGEKWRSAKAIAPLIVGFLVFLSSFIYEIYYLKRYQVKNSDKDSSYNWKLQIDLLFPPEMMKIPNFFPFLIICGLYYATCIIITVVAVEYFTYIENNSAILAAVKAFSLTFGLVFGATIYRESYCRKIGMKNMLIFSAVVSLAAIIWFSRIDFAKTNNYWKYNFISLFMFGYGLNLFFNIYMVIVVENTPLHLQGVVSGVFQTCGQVMLSIGNALVPSIVGTITVAQTYAERKKLHDKFRIVIYVAIGFHVAVFFLMVFTVKNSKPKETQSDDNSENVETSLEASVPLENTEFSEQSGTAEFLETAETKEVCTIGSDSECSVEKKTNNI